MLDRPTFKPHLTLKNLPGVGVIVASGTTHTVLRGRLHELVAPRLDGRPVLEVCRRLRGRASPAEVFYVLSRLEKQGFLTESGAVAMAVDGCAQAALRALERRGSGLIRHGRASFLHHLRGTYEILRRWRQPRHVCLAGLVHSAYSTDRFPDGVFDHGERAQVRELIGEPAERLVYLFCSIPRDELFVVRRATFGRAALPPQFADRWGGAPHVLTPGDIGELLVLHLANAAEQSGTPEHARRFEEYLAQLPSAEEGPWMDHYPGLHARPWHDPRRFALARALERSARQIRKELQALDPDRFEDEGQDIGRVGRWRVLMLSERGRRHDAICRLCPTAAAVLEEQGPALCLNGVAYFSCLDPRTRIAPHRGPTNLRLRCHLGIEVPRDCGLEVGGVTGGWQVGRCVVFDDSLEHAAWNESDRRRVVLVADVWHPDLSDDEIPLLRGLEQHYAARRRFGQWCGKG
jgi:hypothetical protein